MSRLREDTCPVLPSLSILLMSMVRGWCNLKWSLSQIDVNKSIRLHQEMVSDLHEIEGWTRDAWLIPIGIYSVCHGTGAVIPVRNSGPKILARKF
jgi:hypothetical protein